MGWRMPRLPLLEWFPELTCGFSLAFMRSGSNSLRRAGVNENSDAPRMQAELT
jgi:hypothetical protein